MRIALLATGLILSGAMAGASPVNGTGNLTSNVIFGSGNANGSFSGVNNTTDSIELALRGKLRYDLNGNPQAVYNYDGNRTYTFLASQSNAPDNRSVFNFDWSINSDSENLFAFAGDLNDLTYLMSIDYDPTAAVGSVVAFDPINRPYADHAIGTDTTPTSGGTVAQSVAEYQSLIATNNVAQNSWNLGFFEPAGFDPQTPGIYTITLSAFAFDQQLATTSIDIVYVDDIVPVNPVPLPASAPLLLAAVGGAAWVGRRKRR